MENNISTVNSDKQLGSTPTQIKPTRQPFQYSGQITMQQQPTKHEAAAVEKSSNIPIEQPETSKLKKTITKRKREKPLYKVRLQLLNQIRNKEQVIKKLEKDEIKVMQPGKIFLEIKKQDKVKESCKESSQIKDRSGEKNHSRRIEISEELQATISKNLFQVDPEFQAILNLQSNTQSSAFKYSTCPPPRSSSPVPPFRFSSHQSRSRSRSHSGSPPRRNRPSTKYFSSLSNSGKREYPRKSRSPPQTGSNGKDKNQWEQNKIIERKPIEPTKAAVVDRRNPFYNIMNKHLQQASKIINNDKVKIDNMKDLYVKAEGQDVSLIEKIRQERAPEIQSKIQKEIDECKQIQERIKEIEIQMEKRKKEAIQKAEEKQKAKDERSRLYVERMRLEGKEVVPNSETGEEKLGEPMKSESSDDEEGDVDEEVEEEEGNEDAMDILDENKLASNQEIGLDRSGNKNDKINPINTKQQEQQLNEIQTSEAIISANPIIQNLESNKTPQKNKQNSEGQI